MISSMKPGAQVAIALLSLVAWLPTATAQDASPPQDTVGTIPVSPMTVEEPVPRRDEGDADSPTELEEIIVTSTKREKSVRDIPITVNAISGDTLEKSGAQDLRDYLAQVPGVSLNDRGSGLNRVSIRGIAADTVNGNSSANTGVLINDAAFSDPVNQLFSPDLNPFDLQAVEIMKGPQGTLFGAGGLSGAVRYTLQEPQLDVWQTKFFAQNDAVSKGESAQTYGVAVNLPVSSQNAAFRVVVVSRDIPGVVDDLTSGPNYDADRGDQLSARLLGRWDFAESWSLSGFYLSQNTHYDSTSIVGNFDGVLSRDDTPGANTTDADFDVGSLSLKKSFDAVDAILNVSRVGKTFRNDLSAQNTLLPVPHLDLDLVRLRSHQDVSGYQEELRFVSTGGGSWEWVGGLFAQQYTTDSMLDEYALTDASVPLAPAVGQTLGDATALVTLDGPTRADEMAAFGEVTGKFFDDRLEATLGLRAYQTESRANFVVGGLLVTALSGMPSNERKGSTKATGLNPKAALTWHFSKDISVYTSAARGYRYAGFNNAPDSLIDHVPLIYKSDTLWNYELGLRTEWLDRTLRADITGFYIDWTNPQIQQTTSTGLLAYVDNVGAAISRGAESSLRYLLPLPGLSVGFSGAYIRTETREPFNDSSGSEVPVGTELPGTPRLQTSSDIAYGFTVAHDWLFDMGVNWTQVGKAWSNIAHSNTILDYDTWNVSLRIANPELPGHPELNFSALNLTDERGIASAQTSSTYQEVAYIRPRSFMVRLSLAFGD
jgi:iron complex outermembrane receptor protein